MRWESRGKTADFYFRLAMSKNAKGVSLLPFKLIYLREFAICKLCSLPIKISE